MDTFITTMRRAVTRLFLQLLIAGIALTCFELGFMLFAAIYLAIGLLFVVFGLGIIMMPTIRIFKEQYVIESYEPESTYSVLDFVFTDYIESVLQPHLWLVFDDFLQSISESFESRRGSQEDVWVATKTFTEKYFLLTYIHSFAPEFLTEDVMRRELLEFLETTMPKYYGVVCKDSKRLVDWLFSRECPFNADLTKRLLGWIRRKFPVFARLIDRLIITLTENPALVRREPEIFAEIATPAEALVGSPVDVFVYMINMSPKYREKPRLVRVRVLAHGFEPSSLEFVNELEPLVRGGETFEIPAVRRLPIYTKGTEDVCYVLTRMLDIGDVVWIRLTAVHPGDNVIHVLIEDAETGKVLKAFTCTVRARRNFAAAFRSLFGGGIIGGGILYPIVRILMG